MYNNSKIVYIVLIIIWDLKLKILMLLDTVLLLVTIEHVHVWRSTTNLQLLYLYIDFHNLASSSSLC